MNGAQVLVKMLQEYQVRVIFGVPGDTSIPFYDALYNSKHIKHIMARDERSASFMADVYARLTHKPGVCECPSGAGPLYSVPGIAEANASSIPVILLTSDIPLSGEGKQTITELDCQGLFKSISKWSNLIKDVKRIPETIRRAFRIATTGRPSAVHLALPQEILRGKFIEKKHYIYSEGSCISYPAYRTRGSRKVLEELVGHLSVAEKPVIIAGGGTNHSQADKEIIELSEWLKAPVVTTISGQGIIPDEHPLALGVIDDNGFHPHAHRAIEEGDLLIYSSLGMSAGELETIARYNIHAILIHFNNAGFGWIKALQALHCDGRFFSVDFNRGDPKKVVEGFGLKAFRIENLTELEDCLDEAFIFNAPCFLDIQTESEAVELPPVYSWEKAYRNSQGCTG